MRESMYKLLFVDDEPSVLKSLERLFRGERYEIYTATSGDAAIKILETVHMDVIVTDYRMPGMNGIELLKNAKSLLLTAVRIMLTGYSDLDVTIAAINEGEIHKYITKPWNNRDLINLIETVLKQNKSFEKAGSHYLRNDIEREIRDIREALKQSNFSTLRALSTAIELKDRHTKGHCERTMRLSVMLAHKSRISEERIKDLSYAALLHDIGKIGVPLEILNKKGKLSPDEFEIVKQHPQQGALITSEIGFLKVPTRIILEHHERIDGTGYPCGKKSGELLLESRILAIADVFDACTSDRSYRNAMTADDAMRIIIEGKNKLFDGELVDIFTEEMSKAENASLRTPDKAETVQ
jgi:putative two-component system response regulator